MLRQKLQTDNGKLGGPIEGFRPPSAVDFNLPAGGGVQSSVPDAVREKLQAGGLMEGGATEGFTPPSAVDFNLPAGGGAPPSDGVVPTAPTTTPSSTGAAAPVSAGIGISRDDWDG